MERSIHTWLYTLKEREWLYSVDQKQHAVEFNAWSQSAWNWCGFFVQTTAWNDAIHDHIDAPLGVHVSYSLLMCPKFVSAHAECKYAG